MIQKGRQVAGGFPYFRFSRTRHIIGRPELIQYLALVGDVSIQVSVRRFDGSVAEPRLDDVGVHVGFQEVYGCGVP